jgi:aspartate carbamoyltransferase catalytic subunit
MLRHIIDIRELDQADICRLLAMARDGIQPESLAGVTVLTAFFQQSTRTRLGFMSAASRQGGSVIDIGAGEALRIEPMADQMLVVAECADVVVVRHWDPQFVLQLAALRRCAVVNAGSGSASHPTQALIDAFTLQTAISGDVRGTHVLILGDCSLRSVQSFEQLSSLLGVSTRRFAPPSEPTASTHEQYRQLLRWADVVYIKPKGSVDYEAADLNRGEVGDRFPTWVLDPLLDAGVYLLHALPRGTEFPDQFMQHERCLATTQLHCGLAVRGAVLRWILDDVIDTSRSRPLAVRR